MIDIFVIALALTAVQSSRLAQVPFVGCRSDGQLGPQRAPRSGHPPRIVAAAATNLAWYEDSERMGVLAPRGWHCIALYGSDGSFLIVTPTKHSGRNFVGTGRIGINGPAVQLSVSFAGTSGRSEVIPVIARYFPRYRAFVEDVKKMELDFGASQARPYKTDVIRRRTANYLRFMTPAGKQGEGTESWLSPGKLPIEGSRKIVGTRKEPDLLSAEVRLPLELRGLTEAILEQANKPY